MVALSNRATSSKAETMHKLWVPGANNLGTYGRWAFAEFIDVYAIEAAFAKLIDGACLAPAMA